MLISIDRDDQIEISRKVLQIVKGKQKAVRANINSRHIPLTGRINTHRTED